MDRSGPNNRNGPGITGTDLILHYFPSTNSTSDIKTINIYLGDYFYPTVCVCVSVEGGGRGYSEFPTILKCKKTPFYFYK